MILARLALALTLLCAATPADRWAFRYAAEYRTCLWCGRHLRTAQPYFDTDKCGRLWAEQLAVRGIRVHGEELVAVQ